MLVPDGTGRWRGGRGEAWLQAQTCSNANYVTNCLEYLTHNVTVLYMMINLDMILELIK
jgi:hypothetical protein